MAVSTMIMSVWVVTPYRDVGGYQVFGETGKYYLNFHGRFFLQNYTAPQSKRSGSIVYRIIRMSTM